MANRSSQVVKFYGSPEKIQEVLDYLSNCKNHLEVFPEGSTAKLGNGLFVHKDFPSTASSVVNGELHIETSYAPVGIESLSSKFPDVPMCSNSFTDGVGVQDVGYWINGEEIFYLYYDLQGPELWEELTGQKLENGLYDPIEVKGSTSY
jgi:hypothetical protein